MKKMVKSKGHRTAQHPLVTPLSRSTLLGKEEQQWPSIMITLQRWLLNLSNLSEIAKANSMGRALVEIVTVC